MTERDQALRLKLRFNLSCLATDETRSHLQDRCSRADLSKPHTASRVSWEYVDGAITLLSHKRVDDDLYRSGLDCWLIGFCKVVAWPVQVFEYRQQSPQILEQTFWKADNPVQPFNPPWVRTTNTTRCSPTN